MHAEPDDVDVRISEKVDHVSFSFQKLEIIIIFKSLLVDLMEDLVEDIIKLERKPSQCEKSHHHHQHFDHLHNHG